ncbi:translesion error-prone DNA polymerase V autoproteolytic subunit [Chitinophaga niabensis]|uniref:LexA family protein n=1 Tax=Chitinophaga niabensis TaxID=536979 RepID=UPI0031B9DD1C
MKAVGKYKEYVIYALSEKETLQFKLIDVPISAGFPSPALDYMEEELDLVKLFNLNSPTVYVIKVNGDSMRDAYIPSKALIAVDRNITPRDRHLVIAKLNREFTLKRLLKTGAGWMLHPENPEYDPYTIKPDDDFEVWGVVTRIFIDPNLYL